MPARDTRWWQRWRGKLSRGVSLAALLPCLLASDAAQAPPSRHRRAGRHRLSMWTRASPRRGTWGGCAAAPGAAPEPAPERRNRHATDTPETRPRHEQPPLPHDRPATQLRQASYRGCITTGAPLPHDSCPPRRPARPPPPPRGARAPPGAAGLRAGLTRRRGGWSCGGLAGGDLVAAEEDQHAHRHEVEALRYGVTPSTGMKPRPCTG